MTDTSAPPSQPAPKASPESLALRASPKPVTRLSRKALALLLGSSAVIIAGAGLWALRPPTKTASKSDLYTTDHKPTAEGLLGLPTTYAGVGKPAEPGDPEAWAATPR